MRHPAVRPHGAITKKADMIDNARRWIRLALYALSYLPGCSIVMALNRTEEPKFDHTVVGATKEESDYEFRSPGVVKTASDGLTEVTYTDEMGDAPNSARAWIYFHHDLIFIGIPEPVFTFIELLSGRTEETTITYNPNNTVATIAEYTPPTSIGRTHSCPSGPGRIRSEATVSQTASRLEGAV